jgi:hypothetical protein
MRSAPATVVPAGSRPSETGPPPPHGSVLPRPVRVIALWLTNRPADNVVVMAHAPHTTDRREDEARDDRSAPPWPLSASKTAAARRRDLTDLIRRAREA